jgi:hypothetical protein
MLDDDARFCAELARSVGRLDWWNIKDEHTAYEWAAQVAMFYVCPFGERRADLRTAVSTAHLIAMQSAKKIEDAEFGELVRNLSDYLKCYSPNTDEVDMTALQNMLENDNGK